MSSVYWFVLGIGSTLAVQLLVLCLLYGFGIKASRREGVTKHE